MSGIIKNYCNKIFINICLFYAFSCNSKYSNRLKCINKLHLLLRIETDSVFLDFTLDLKLKVTNTSLQVIVIQTVRS